MIFPFSMQTHNPFLKAAKLFATKISGTPAVYIGSVKGFEDEKNCASAKCSYFGKESRPETQAVTHRPYCFLSEVIFISIKAEASKTQAGTLNKKSSLRANRIHSQQKGTVKFYFVSITNPSWYQL